MKVVAVIQARVSSSRLPGKVLLDIRGEPMVIRVVERVRLAKRLSDVVLATSTDPSDDPLAELCDLRGVKCVRGSLNDVLDRFYNSAITVDADVIVRVTADCPLIDPAVIDRTIEKLMSDRLDYASNLLPRASYPDGLDCEVFTVAALKRAWQEASQPAEREHVTPYLRVSGRFTTGGVTHTTDLSRHRWTVDDPADLAFIRRVYGALGDRPFAGLEELMTLLIARPDLAAAQGTAPTNEGYAKSLFEQASAIHAPKPTLIKSREWAARSSKVLPSIAQTFSKGPSQYVQGASPIFLQRGSGCRVWDVDGNEYIDYVQGLLPNILGYAHPEVNAAFTAQIAEGHSFSMPHPLEVELAERLTRIIPCAEMVKFAKNGSDATGAAVRVARAFTGRDRVACCGYHGWQDWYIGSTTRNRGVPQAVRELTHSFPYNDSAKLEEMLAAYPNQFAAVIMEPVNFTSPVDGYLERVKKIAHKHGAMLIFDEICSGFHFGLGGAQKKFGVTPDIACFGKAMGNGFPIAAICGRADVMAVFDEIFVSFTFAGEVASMSAAMKVLDILEQSDALARMDAAGRQIQDGFNSLARFAGLNDRLACVGYPVWSLMKFRDASGQDCLLTRSLFQQEAVKRGILHLVTHNMTAAHDTAAVNQTLTAYAGVMKTLAGWLSDTDPHRHLDGPMIQPVFRVR